MAFTWKEHKDIFKGEGVYFLTFVVVNRADILGTLESLHTPDKEGRQAWVRATELGKAVLRKVNELESRFSTLQILHKELMPNHLHVVIRMHEGFEGSIKMVARGFAQGCSKMARQLMSTPSMEACSGAVGSRGELLIAQSDCAINTDAPATDAPATDAPATDTPATDAAMKEEPTAATPLANYDCGNGANTLFSTPFIRTLAHKGQLTAMIRYAKANPDNAWRRRRNPELYVIRRNRVVAGLHFDIMGKERLLDYPDRQTVALSRSLTEEQIAEEVRKALWHAERGVVTYTAAIANGEKAVARAVREAGYPLVIMMLDGFPAEGTEAARYFHPSGVYHTACGEGRLLLMAPSPGNYTNEMLIALTDEELRRKAVAKGLPYSPIPHDSKRWRMMAGNVMLTQLTVCNT